MTNIGDQRAPDRETASGGRVICYDDMVKGHSRCLVALVFGLLTLTACADPNQGLGSGEVAPIPKKMTVWLTEDGIDADTADRLAAVGVDQLVVRRGSILLASGAPVVRLLASPPVAGPIPIAVALEVRGLGSTTDDDAADAVWAALEADFGDQPPVQLILDLPELGDGAGGFVSRLAQRSGLAVVPILTAAQLDTEIGRGVARAAHRCIVPAFGSQDADLRGLGGADSRPLSAKLAAVRDLDVRVRAAVGLRPKTSPEVDGWAADVDVLTDETVAEIKRTSTLNRSFLTKGPLSWAGRSFAAGETIAVAWVDAARLGLFLTECHRTILPEVDGWDLVSLPPVGPNLGLDREELIRYLGGEGPAPEVEVQVKRNGRNLSVRLANPSVFRSAITGFGNWVQVELESGMLVATSRGTFDHVILGELENGEWRPNPTGGPNAVRFAETYLAPGEELETGSIRLPSNRSKVRVRWQIQVSDGSTVTGVVD